MALVYPVPRIEIPDEKPVPSCDCGCACGGEQVDQGCADGGQGDDSASCDGVRWLNGQVRVDATDLKSDGFGQHWEHTRVYDNLLSSAADSGQGNNWAVFRWSYLVKDPGDNSITVVRATKGTLWFDDVTIKFQPRYGALSTLVHDDVADTYTLTLPCGTKLEYHDFDQTTFRQGALKREVAPGGQVTAVESYTGGGQIAEFRRVAVSSNDVDDLTGSFLNSYDGDERLTEVLQRTRVNTGSWTNVRRSLYDYYGTGSSFGMEGDLKRVRVQSYVASTWVDVDITLYRYYTSNTSPGFEHGLRFVLNPKSYARMVGDSLDPLTASDTVLATYANFEYGYDSSHRVVSVTTEGGTETSSYAYTAGTTSTDPAEWAMKTVMTRPDASQLVVYTNFLGQPLLTENRVNSSTAGWIDYYEYATLNRMTLHAHPSAVIGYNDTSANLSIDLRTDAGLIETTSYVTGSGAVGRVASRAVQQGSGGTPVPQAEYTYTSQTAGGATAWFLASRTMFRADDGTGDIETYFAYTFHSGTTQVEQRTTTFPVVTTGQNGPNVAAETIAVFDAASRLRWTMDEEGTLGYRAYDLGTGALVKSIVDVDDTLTTEFEDLPSGWTTPVGGGLNLITTYEVDILGRPTKMTRPEGNFDYMVYNDAAHETRLYPCWNTGTDIPTGPTQVTREDRANGYVESLTMSATPSVSSGRPTGAESVSSVQSLSRTLFAITGMVEYQDRYFDLTGTSYSTARAFGTVNVNYYRDTPSYDNRGRVVRTLAASGTISRTVFDFLGRGISQWVGTNDTPASGTWSSTNNTSPSNMVKVVENEYDNGGIGDGNLTKSTAFPAGSTADRVAKTWFDWRNRPVASKGGVETSESTSVHRPISFVDYDNLNRVVKSRSYDGDGVTITVTAGVPVAPSSSLLRAQSESFFDEMGRQYRTKTFSVNQSSGTVSTDALTTNNYFSLRGQGIATSAPGGSWQKASFDGAGRTTASYLTDGAGGTSWAAAGGVTGDKVLEQNGPTYDDNGNVLLTTSKQRFDDATGTGALGDPSSGIPARNTFAAMYYDKADRPVAFVNVGTNGGSPYTRPGSVPSRSDTVLVTDTVYDSAGHVWKVIDSKALENRTTYDLLGRTKRTVENYTNGTVTDGSNKTVDYTYNSVGMTKLKVVLPSIAFQETEWVFGVTTSDGNDLSSNDIVKEMRYPDPSSGSPSSTSKDVYAYNRLGQRKKLTDRNGNVHDYLFDVLGRGVSDAVSTLGSSVDGAVRRRETAYDTQTNPYLFTTYNAASSGSVVNQVKREFNGMRQPVKEWQEHSGAVGGSSRKVEYSWLEMASGANNSRLTGMTYPDSYALTFNYASGLDADISRLSSISDSSNTLEALTYLGLGTAVKRAHSQPGVDLSYIKLSGESNGDAGDKYIGLDRFGRVVDQRWLNGTPTDLDRYQHGYDRNSNRLWKYNVVNTARSELYTYDDLNQIATYGLGTLNGGKTALTTTLGSQAWDYDAAGNWEGLSINGGSETRGHNRQNEIVNFDGEFFPTYDLNGNMTRAYDETRLFVYDAWNKMVKVTDATPTTLVAYANDALNRRVSSTESSVTTDRYFSAAWQLLETYVSTSAKERFVWSPVYVDAMILRNRSVSGTLDERVYALQDANFNVTALANTSGSIVERIAYTPFGVPNFMDASWTAAADAYAWTFLHQGGERGAADLYLFRNRSYSPGLGRWMQEDPIGYDSFDLNIYLYLKNGPLSRLDPSGNIAVPIFIFFAAMACIASAAIEVHQDGPIIGTGSGWTHDKYAHCLASCLIAVRCGNIISLLTGHFKERMDQLLSNHEGYSMDDMVANNIGVSKCSLSNDSCRVCCAKYYDPKPKIPECKPMRPAVQIGIDCRNGKPVLGDPVLYPDCPKYPAPLPSNKPPFGIRDIIKK